MEAWEQEQQAPMDILQMQELIRQYAQARNSYDEAKAVSTEKYKKVEELEEQVSKALIYYNQKNFEVTGVGKVSVSQGLYYQFPKDTEDKRGLFKYIQDRYGVDALTGMLSIHASSFNSWAKKEIEAGVEQIPHVSQPVEEIKLSFRRS